MEEKNTPTPEENNISTPEENNTPVAEENNTPVPEESNTSAPEEKKTPTPEGKSGSKPSLIKKIKTFAKKSTKKFVALVLAGVLVLGAATGALIALLGNKGNGNGHSNKPKGD